MDLVPIPIGSKGRCPFFLKMWDLIPELLFQNMGPGPNLYRKGRCPKSLFLIPLSFAFYFVLEVGIGAQKSDLKSHLSFAFYFVPEVKVGAQKSDF